MSHRRILVVAAMLVLAILPSITAHAADADFSTWTAVSYPGDGTDVTQPGVWAVSEAGTAVMQQKNGAPTFFAAPDSAVGSRVTASFNTTAGDNDFYGVALGFHPAEVADPAADYLLVDWKQADQDIDWFGGASGNVTGRAGLAVSRVSGIPVFDEMWSHVDQPENSLGGVTELARGLTLGNDGWSTGVTHTFEIEYTATELRVWVDGLLELDLTGDFPDGPFALYNFSQARVLFTAVTIEDINDPPEVLDGGAADVVADEGQFGATAGSFGDPDGDPLSLTCAGECSGFGGNTDGTWDWSQLLVEGPDSFSVTVTASDDNLTVADTFTVTVLNVDPVITSAHSTSVAGLGTGVTATADFTDAGVLDTHTATFEWGDGESSSGAVTETDGSGTTSADHTYAAPGLYTITITVTDDDGGSDTAVVDEVFVFDPDTFVTGGGWIASPEGALVADPGHSGKATFGFVARYARDATVRGNLQFQVHKGLNLHATGFDHLLIQGGIARFSGAGRVNGEDGYRFEVVATDERIAGTGDDLFWITITKDGAVVYDGSTYPAQGLPIVGRGIQVHTKG